MTGGLRVALQASLAVLTYWTTSMPGAASRARADPSVRHVEGIVDDWSLPGGWVRLRNTVGFATLHALPGDILHLQRDDRVVLTYRDFGDRLWVASRSGPESGVSFAEANTLIGNLTALDVTRGTLQVGAGTLRGHPELLEGLSPGQFLALRVVRIGDARWVLDIEARFSPREVPSSPRANR